MSRELKFRVWDKEDRGYREITAMLWRGKYLYLAPSEGKSLPPNDPSLVCDGQGFKMTDGSDRDRLVIEQYTGVKDRNGVEIYEGDILALSFGYVPTKCNEAKAEKIRRMTKATVYYDELSVSFKYRAHYAEGKLKDCRFKPGTAVTCLEVVGNIHENPELLEKKL